MFSRETMYSLKKCSVMSVFATVPSLCHTLLTTSPSLDMDTLQNYVFSNHLCFRWVSLVPCIKVLLLWCSMVMKDKREKSLTDIWWGYSCGKNPSKWILTCLFSEFDGNDCVLCRVCGDKASGFHYGVHSCEGCKVGVLPVVISRIFCHHFEDLLRFLFHLKE